MKFSSFNRWIASAALFGFSAVAHAVVMAPPPWSPPISNQVAFEVSAEQWVTTKTAKVVVAVNAAVNEQQLVNAYGDISQKLQKLMGDAQWHITAFDRTTDKTGLEQLSITAETRLPESNLSTLKEKLKVASKAGETYTVASVDYTPTLAERETAESALRTQIYNQIKNELAQLNATFPNQKYSLHSINFMQETAPMPGPLMLAATANAVSRQANPPAAVSNSLQLRARVVLATAPVMTTATGN